MKAILEFNLPEDAEEHANCLQGRAAKAALWDLDQFLRGRIKHGEMSDDARAAYTDAREALHNALSDHGITLSD